MDAQVKEAAQRLKEAADAENTGSSAVLKLDAEIKDTREELRRLDELDQLDQKGLLCVENARRRLRALETRIADARAKHSELVNAKEQAEKELAKAKQAEAKAEAERILEAIVHEAEETERRYHELVERLVGSIASARPYPDPNYDPMVQLYDGLAHFRKGDAAPGEVLKAIGTILRNAKERERAPSPDTGPVASMMNHLPLAIGTASGQGLPSDRLDLGAEHFPVRKSTLVGVDDPTTLAANVKSWQEADALQAETFRDIQGADIGEYSPLD